MRSMVEGRRRTLRKDRNSGWGRQRLRRPLHRALRGPPPRFAETKRYGRYSFVGIRTGRVR